MATFIVSLWAKISFTASVSVVTFLSVSVPPLIENPPVSGDIV